MLRSARSADLAENRVALRTCPNHPASQNSDSVNRPAESYELTLECPSECALRRGSLFPPNSSPSGEVECVHSPTFWGRGWPQEKPTSHRYPFKLERQNFCANSAIHGNTPGHSIRRNPHSFCSTSRSIFSSPNHTRMCRPPQPSCLDCSSWRLVSETGNDRYLPLVTSTTQARRVRWRDGGVTC